MQRVFLILGVLSSVVIAEALQVFSLPLTKIQQQDLESRRQFHKRQFQSPLINRFPFYYAEITLGTPPRRLQVHLDTGSSDLVVHTDSSDFCTSNPTACAPPAGTYNANGSGTSQYFASDFQIAYLSGEVGSGDYVNDTFTIGSAALDNFHFGVMYKSTVADNVLGVGLIGNEYETLYLSPPRPYPNLPVALVNAGYIPSASFSLYLNNIRDIGASTGNILFGGIDTQKYCGPLRKLPMVPNSGFPFLGIIEYNVALEGISGTKNGVASVFPSGNAPLGSALLDSGTSVTFLPSALANEIFALVGAVFNPAESLAKVPCNITEEDIILHFKFATIVIDVSISQLVGFPDGTGFCYFGITPGSVFGSDSVILGDTFLSSAYAVFDAENKNIYLAQAKFDAEGENILQIRAGVDGVPQPDGAACNVLATTTSSTTTSSTTSTSRTTSSTSTSCSTSKPTKKATNKATKKATKKVKPTSTPRKPVKHPAPYTKPTRRPNPRPQTHTYPYPTVQNHNNNNQPTRNAQDPWKNFNKHFRNVFT